MFLLFPGSAFVLLSKLAIAAKVFCVINSVRYKYVCYRGIMRLFTCKNILFSGSYLHKLEEKAELSFLGGVGNKCKKIYISQVVKHTIFSIWEISLKDENVLWGSSLDWTCSLMSIFFWMSSFFLIDMRVVFQGYNQFSQMKDLSALPQHLLFNCPASSLESLGCYGLWKGSC